MDSAQAVSEVTTWAQFAFVVWKDVWGYMATTGIGLAIGILLPQLKLKNPLNKGPKPE